MTIHNITQSQTDLQQANINLATAKNLFDTKNTELANVKILSVHAKIKDKLNSVSAKDKLQWEVDSAKIQVNFKNMEVSFAKIRIILAEINALINNESNIHGEGTSAAEDSGSEVEASEESEEDSPGSGECVKNSDYKNNLSERLGRLDFIFKKVESDYRNYSTHVSDINKQIEFIKNFNDKNSNKKQADKINFLLNQINKQFLPSNGLIGTVTDGSLANPVDSNVISDHRSGASSSESSRVSSSESSSASSSES